MTVPPYGAGPGGPPPMPVGTPVRPSRPGGALLVGSLSCCGLIAVLGVVLVIVVGQNMGNSELVKGQSTMPAAKRNLTEIRSALDSYTESHDGNYPVSLDKLVDTIYLSVPSPVDGKPEKINYFRPTRETPNDTTIASFYLGKFDMNIGNRTTSQRFYAALLKDGTIVQEQVARTPLEEADPLPEGNRASK